MTSYSPNFFFTEITPFDPAFKNAWGPVVNGDFTLIDSAIAGGLTLSVAGNSNVILTSIQGQPDQARNYSFKFTGALTGNIIVFWPNGVNRNLRVTNSTTGNHTLTVAVNNGSGVAAGTVYAVPQANTSYLASDGTNISQQITDGSQLNGVLTDAGGTITGNLIIAPPSGNASLTLDGTVFTFRGVFYQSSGSNRWLHGANAVVETGANAGSDFVINRFDDSGASIDTPLKITRSTGVMSLTQTPTFPTAGLGDSSTKGATTAFAAANYYPLAGGNLTGNVTIKTGASGATLTLDSNTGTFRSLVYQSNDLNRWILRTSATAESGGNAGSDFLVARYNDAGALVDIPVTVTRSTGVASFIHSPTMPTASPNNNSTNGATTAYADEVPYVTNAGKNAQGFFGAGTAPYTVDSVTFWLDVEVVGGGGAGGGSNTNYNGGGGGAGGYSRAWVAVTPGQVISVTVGVGGAATTTNGGNGGTSSFGAFLTATGGIGGRGAAGNCTGGAGGQGAGSAVAVFAGGYGADGVPGGGPISTGIGGASFFGGGTKASTTVIPFPVAAPGSGGGGTYNNTSATVGNIGQVGCVIVRS